jgi:hypothetical protein
VARRFEGLTRYRSLSRCSHRKTTCSGETDREL